MRTIHGFGSFDYYVQMYRRLTRVPIAQRTRRAWLTARENQRSALPLLREGLVQTPIFDHIMQQLRQAPLGLSAQELLHGTYTRKSLMTEVSSLYLKSARAGIPLLQRSAEYAGPGGWAFIYRLTTLGAAVMDTEPLD